MLRRLHIVLLVIGWFAATTISLLATPIQAQDCISVDISRVSTGIDGAQGNDDSYYPGISSDGRFVVFNSLANNLVPNDTNDVMDIFVHDRQTGQTTRVSVADNGSTEGNKQSEFPTISDDGRFVAFDSAADNLVPGDTNNTTDVFVHDRQTGQTTRVSVATDGTQGDSSSFTPVLSADGRFVTFLSSAGNLVPNDTNDTMDVFVYDRQTGQTTLVSVAYGIQANGTSYHPTISASGRFVAFDSFASSLTPDVGDTVLDSNRKQDIFVHDMETGEITRVSLAANRKQGNDASYYPALSANGRFIAFHSDANNLVLNDDTNGVSDIFFHDRQTGETSLVSLSSDGMQGNDISYDPALSSDGRFVAFTSDASNLVPGDTNIVEDVFIRDRQTEKTIRISLSSDGTEANGGSGLSVFSNDGRFVAFSSHASNLVPDDTNGAMDIFIVRLASCQMSPNSLLLSATPTVFVPKLNQPEGCTLTDLNRISITGNGTQITGASAEPALSANGRFVAFTHDTSKFMAGDTLFSGSIFTHDRQTGETVLVSVDSNGNQANGSSKNPVISSDGRFVAFESFANNLVPNDTNGWFDIFVHDQQTGQTTRVSIDSNGTQANSNSVHPVLSGDGRFVVFQSSANNLVSNDTNSTDDIFVHDRQTGQTTRVSIDSYGVQANGNSYVPAFSADGRFVAFTSSANNLVSDDTNNFCSNPSTALNNVSCPDIFVHDQYTGQTTRISLPSDGTQGSNSAYDPALSADGRFVAFANNFLSGNFLIKTEVYVHDQQTGETSRVSVSSSDTLANNSSYSPAISSDGRFVTFWSTASNLAPDDTKNQKDVFVHDRLTRQTILVSVAIDGNPGQNDSYDAEISSDGQLVVFTSLANNLVPGDTHAQWDVFAVRLNCPTIMLPEAKPYATSQP